MAEDAKGTGLTVSGLIDRLYRFPGNTPVGIATGPGSDQEILRVHAERKNKNQTIMIWIEVRERNK